MNEFIKQLSELLDLINLLETHNNNNDISHLSDDILQKLELYRNLKEEINTVQHKYQIPYKSNVQQEIHADILAGWYIAKYLEDLVPEKEKYWGDLSETRKKNREIANDLYLTFGFMGDDHYWSPNHHGNRITRNMAFYTGYYRFDSGWDDWKEIFLTLGGRNTAQGVIDDFNNE